MRNSTPKKLDERIVQWRKSLKTEIKEKRLKIDEMIKKPRDLAK